MRSTRRTCSYTLESEELGQTLDFTLEYVIDPGEPMVWRTANGDGYPGSPATAEIVSARCTRIIDEQTDRKPTDREAEDVGNWFLDQINSNDDTYERVSAACFHHAEGCRQFALAQAEDDAFERYLGIR